MANIKVVVNLLCNILEEMGCSPLLPETFRCAKFDDASVVDDFWRLLFELMCFKRSGSVKQESFSGASLGEMALFAKRELFLDGYNIGTFIALPITKAEQGSSRELLLAFGWLIATGGIFEKFSNQCADVDGLFTAEVKRQILLENVSTPQSSKVKSHLDIDQKIQEALVINGKLQALFNSIAQADREHLKLLQRLECSHSSPDIMKNPLTVNVVLSGQTNLIVESIKLLERDKRRLTYLVQWRQQEFMFWQWLESVLEEKIKNPPALLPDALKTGYNQIIGDSYKKMTDFLLLASRSEKILRERVKGVTPEDADHLVELINNDLEEFLKPPSKAEKSPKLLDKNVKNAGSSRVGRHSQAPSDIPMKSLKSADIGLHKLCDRLELELKVDQKEFCDLLKEIAEANLGSSF